MQLFNKSEQRLFISLLTKIPSKLEYRLNQPAKAIYINGDCSTLSCMNCTTPYCMQFLKGETDCIEIPSFPADKNINVCPVDAIKWNKINNTPEIDNDKCITCGICLRRCPIGAIYFDGEMRINKKIGATQQQEAPTQKTLQLHNEQIKALENIEKSGLPIFESDELMTDIYQKLLRINHSYHNIIVRNLLISLGCNCSMRRIGDVYTRMDAFYSSPDNSHGAVEVEFSKDTLEASRGILDDVAVLYTRYEIPKEENTPLVVCLQLPNSRQGYWQVVKDVKNVEDIIINTVTIGSLIILNWNGCLLLPDDLTYYLDYDNTDLRKSISYQIGRKLNISDKLLGIFEPIK